VSSVESVVHFFQMLLAFHKPYGVLSQFTPDGSAHQTLKPFGFPDQVYPLGRLDADSEGLLLLSDEPGLNNRLLDPKNQHARTYWAQVEGIPTEESLKKLRLGPVIQGYRCLPCQAILPDPQPVPPLRTPPIRERKTIPTSWMELELIEGKNRQVRRMTAAIGHPTLRLIRVKIGQLELGTIPLGTWKEVDLKNRSLLMKMK
jgi:23S rRNA pseudouridine2457 synthase